MKENNFMDNEKIRKKLAEKDNARKKYLEKLELLKQKYGVEFEVNSFSNHNIDKIKFYNLEYKKSLKNVVVIYDNKLKKYNYISYDFESEKTIKDLTNNKIINDLNKEKKLKLLIDEIQKVNNEYLIELEEIDKKMDIEESIDRELEINRKSKKD